MMANDLRTEQFSAHGRDDDDDTGEARTVEPGSVEEIEVSDDTADSGTPAAPVSFAPLNPPTHASGTLPVANAANTDASAASTTSPASTDAMPAPSPFPRPAQEHVELPQPAAAPAFDAQATEPVHKARHASPVMDAPQTGTPMSAPQPNVPQMPDLRETGDDRSRNEFTTVYDILDGIESTLNEAKAGFFTPNMVKVDRDALSAQLEELKKMLPVQLERASALMREAERRLEGAQTQANAIVAAAQSRAADMIKEANDQAQFLSGQENVVALAQAKARATMDAAQAKADRLTGGADKYCVDVMQSLDQQLDKLKQDVNAGLNVLYARQQRAAQDYAAVQEAAGVGVTSATDRKDQQ